MWRLLLLLLLALPAAAHAAPAWVQYVGSGGAEARALADGDRCPEARVDGEARAMAVRAGPEPGFPGSVCALSLPEGARRVAVGGSRLPAPPRTVRRILILGDTGCRMKGAQVQVCDDPRQWPFPTVARLAAEKRPDLVIHVGDYDYRETPCPAAEAGCRGSPYGDRQESWDADFLHPAAPLLAAAPWVMVRGNHESCSRTGRGWTRMLAAEPAAAECRTAERAYTVALPGGPTLAVVDSAEADDRAPSPRDVADMAAQLEALSPLLARPGGGSWLLTHRPVWALVPAVRLGPLGILDIGINATEQAAARGRDLSGVDAVVSGHIHHFAAYDFAGARPSQLVVGTGGDIGEKADTPRARGGTVQIDGLPAERYTFYRFGYLLLERSGQGGWRGTFHDMDDRVAATCRLAERRLSCRSAHAPAR